MKRDIDAIERLQGAFRPGHGTRRRPVHKDAPLPSFYALLQESPATLKHRIRSLHAPAAKRRVAAALILRALLIMAFAIVFIGGFKALFGPQASAPAVAFFVMVLCLRFVGFNYRLRDNIASLAIVCTALTAGPLLAMHAGPFARFAVNLAALFTIFVVGVDDARFGNGGTYGFIYTYLAGMLVAEPLPRAEVPARLATMATGFAICAAVHLISRRRIAPTDRRLADALRGFDPHSVRNRYQIRAALGISAAMLAADLAGLERIMWVGIVASSMLTPHGFKVVDRMGWRVGFTCLGAALFTLVYPALPDALLAIFPLVGGLGNGLSGTYQWQQVFNTLGALVVGSSALGGVGAAAFWRVADTVFAVVASLLLSGAMGWMASRRLGWGEKLYEE